MKTSLDKEDPAVALETLNKFTLCFQVPEDPEVYLKQLEKDFETKTRPDSPCLIRLDQLGLRRKEVYIAEVKNEEPSVKSSTPVASKKRRIVADGVPEIAPTPPRKVKRSKSEVTSSSDTIDLTGVNTDSEKRERRLWIRNANSSGKKAKRSKRQPKQSRDSNKGEALGMSSLFNVSEMYSPLMVASSSTTSGEELEKLKQSSSSSLLNTQRNGHSSIQEYFCQLGASF